MTKIPHWIYLVCGLGQILIFGVLYLLCSVIIQSGLNYQFSAGAGSHFKATLVLFSLGTVFQWLVVQILGGDFRKRVAALNLALLAFIVFSRTRFDHSLLLLCCCLLSLVAILVLFQRLQKADPPEPLEESDVLDDNW